MKADEYSSGIFIRREILYISVTEKSPTSSFIHLRQILFNSARPNSPERNFIQRAERGGEFRKEKSGE
jgi:hypothetical protein